MTTGGLHVFEMVYLNRANPVAQQYLILKL